MSVQPAFNFQEPEKIWLDSYPEGVPSEIDAEAYGSIIDVLRQSTDQFKDRPSFANLGTELTYGDLDLKTRDFAAYLQSRLNLKKGDRVAIMMPNLLQYPVALFGALRAGLTVTNINPLYKPRELRHQLVDSDAVCIVLLENFCANLEKVLKDSKVKSIIVTRAGDLLRFPKSVLVNFAVKHIKKMVPAYSLPDVIDFKHTLRVGSKLMLQPVDINLKDIAFIQYTAGTTGMAKGVVLSHGNIVANIQQTSAWIGPFTDEGKEIIVTPLPLYHIFSLTANCLLYMKIGALIHLITNPRDFKGFVRELKPLRFTAITGVNTLYNALLNTPGFTELDFSNFKTALGGGMAIQPSVAEHWKQVTGRTLIEAYGLTETSPGICMNPFDLEEFNGKIGLPIPSTECCIKSDGGEMLPAGGIGEMCVRGPQVMQGYLNQPEKTAAVLEPDGWFHTGDVAVMDEKGFFKILERKDDMIVVSGFNVYPSEVESVVAKHPGVLEVAAIGVPDEKSGAVVKIFVVRKDPALTEEEILRHCKKELTAYKIPKQITFLDTLPKSPVGKVLRRKLREA